MVAESDEISGKAWAQLPPFLSTKLDFQDGCHILSALGKCPGAKLIPAVTEEFDTVAVPVKIFYKTDRKLLWAHLAELPEEVLQAVRVGRAVLLLDASGEGNPLSDHAFDELHGTLEALQIPFQAVVFLTQNHYFAEQYRSWREEGDIAAEIGITVFHSVLWMLLNFVDQPNVAAETEARRSWVESESFIAEHRPKKFLCLNYTPRRHRTAAVLYILYRDLESQGYISFTGMSSRKQQRETGAVELSRLTRLAEKLAEYLPELSSKCPLVLDVDPAKKQAPTKNLGNFEHYRGSYFSFVTETDIDSSTRRRFTEKIFKPVLGGHPFVVYGAAHTLEDFRALGLRTFHPWINEEYDLIEDTRERTAAVFLEFSRLCAFTPAQWSVLLEQLREVVLHNLNWFRNRLRTVLEDEQLLPLALEIKRRCG